MIEFLKSHPSMPELFSSSIPEREALLGMHEFFTTIADDTFIFLEKAQDNNE